MHVTSNRSLNSNLISSRYLLLFLKPDFFKCHYGRINWHNEDNSILLVLQLKNCGDRVTEVHIEPKSLKSWKKSCSSSLLKADIIFGSWSIKTSLGFNWSNAFASTSGSKWSEFLDRFSSCRYKLPECSFSVKLL